MEMAGLFIERLLLKMDIFGLSVSFRVFSEKYHKTIFGGLITLFIWCIMLYQLISLTKFVYDQESPSIIQQINYVKQPEYFKFSPNTFSMAFGLEDPLGIHFKDESIYIVKAFMYNNKRVFNDTTGEFVLNSQIVEVKIENCTKEHFKIEGTEEYFQSLPLNKLYCFGLNEENIGIEGEFSALIYKQLNIQVLECDSPSCADKTIRTQKLAYTKLGIYTSDNLIQVTNRDKPFMSIGRNMFWVTGTGLQKEIRFQLINNYIKTDLGIMRQSIKHERVISFSSERELVLNRQSSLMYNFFLNYEKNKEIVYERKYMKLDQAFSQVGGTFNVLISIGCLLCWPISQIELNRKIINSVFSIDEEDLDQKNQNEEQKEGQNITNELSTLKQNISKCLKKTGNNNNNNTLSTSVIKNNSSSPNQQPQISQKVENENENFIQQIFSYSYSELKIKFCDYFSSYFSFCKRNSAKKQILKYGTNILYNHIDILNIINKLVEIDKLKHLLLNENQIKLFDYIPKPQLKLSQMKVQQDDTQLFERKLRNQFMIDSFVSNHNPQTNTNFPSSNKNDVSLFFTSQKTQKQKSEEAYQAFNNISNQNLKMTKIDKKLIQMVDQRLVNLFNNNEKKFNQSRVLSRDQLFFQCIDSPFSNVEAQQINNRHKNHQFLSLNDPNVQINYIKDYSKIDEKEDKSKYFQEEEENKKEIQLQYTGFELKSLSEIKCISKFSKTPTLSNN